MYWAEIRKNRTNPTTLFLLIISFCMLFTGLQGQQFTDYAQYRYNAKNYNPAALSTLYLRYKKNWLIGASHRLQMAGFEDAPQTSNLWLEYNPSGQNISVGGAISNDDTGPFSQTGIVGNFAYRLQFASRANQALLIGINAGVLQYRANLAEIPDPENNGEPFAMQSISRYKPDVAFGLFYHYEDRYYAGLSATQTIAISRNYDEYFRIQEERHYYALAGASFPIQILNYACRLEPSAWFRYLPNHPLALDFRLKLQFQDLFWVEAGSDITNSLLWGTGIFIGDQSRFDSRIFTIGLSFEHSIASHGPLLGGTYEFTAGYAWK